MTATELAQLNNARQEVIRLKRSLSDALELNDTLTHQLARATTPHAYAQDRTGRTLMLPSPHSVCGARD